MASTSQIAPARPRTLVVCLDSEGVDISQTSTLITLYNLLEPNSDQIAYYTVPSHSCRFCPVFTINSLRLSLNLFIKPIHLLAICGVKSDASRSSGSLWHSLIDFW